MTLPKTITRLVDEYRQAVEEDYSDGLGGTPSPRTMAVRAALEAAIADHIADAGKKVEPPTDTAEAMRIVAELHRMRCVLMLTDERVRDYVVERAAALQPVSDPYKLEPPTDAEVEAWEREARKVDLSVCTDCPGELYELRGDHLAKGLAIMRRARATDALAKLRERVQKEMEINHRNPMRCTSLEIQDDCLRAVRDWIDEAQQDKEAKR